MATVTVFSLVCRLLRLHNAELLSMATSYHWWFLSSYWIELCPAAQTRYWPGAGMFGTWPSLQGQWREEIQCPPTLLLFSSLRPIPINTHFTTESPWPKQEQAGKRTRNMVVVILALTIKSTQIVWDAANRTHGWKGGGGRGWMGEEKTLGVILLHRGELSLREQPEDETVIFEAHCHIHKSDGVHDTNKCHFLFWIQVYQSTILDWTHQYVKCNHA